MMCDHNFAAAAADYDGDKSVDDIDIDDDGTLNSQTMLYDFICIFVLVVNAIVVNRSIDADDDRVIVSIVCIVVFSRLFIWID